jgi:outer membrane protein OmpA-like peptidoglycan-associated protein
MTASAARFGVLFLAAVLLTACCCRVRVPNDLIVVLPASDGHIGGVVVETGGDKIVLDKAYAGVKPGAAGAGPIEVGQAEVEQAFGNALAARPIPPKSYTLYFMSGSDELVPDSRAALEAMLAEISERKAVEIVITGHTDTTGAAGDNDRLSLNRAKSVESQLRDTFAAKGVKSESVTTVGRGERELLVKTPDRVAEARNRRVEITVR